MIEHKKLNNSCIESFVISRSVTKLYLKKPDGFRDWFQPLGVIFPEKRKFPVCSAFTLSSIKFRIFRLGDLHYATLDSIFSPNFEYSPAFNISLHISYTRNKQNFSRIGDSGPAQGPHRSIFCNVEALELVTYTTVQFCTFFFLLAELNDLLTTTLCGRMKATVIESSYYKPIYTAVHKYQDTYSVWNNCERRFKFTEELWQILLHSKQGYYIYSPANRNR